MRLTPWRLGYVISCNKYYKNILVYLEITYGQHENTEIYFVSMHTIMPLDFRIKLTESKTKHTDKV